MAELARNLAETTLASGYTAGAGSISVASAAGFPTTGTFRVRLGNAGTCPVRTSGKLDNSRALPAEPEHGREQEGDLLLRRPRKRRSGDPQVVQPGADHDAR